MASRPLNLPPGFRFRPTDKELVDFLKRKVRGSIEMEHDIITEVDICKCEPWDLPGKLYDLSCYL